MRRAAFATLFLLAACATASAPGLQPRAEDLAPPSPHQMAVAFTLTPPASKMLGPDLKLWGTHYHTPIMTPASAAAEDVFPLINRNGDPISAPLRRKDWCDAALQGSVAVKSGGKTVSYIYVDADGPEQANCDSELGNLSDGVKNATRRARFKIVDDPLGCETREHPLAPFRTIAVDPAVIPVGSVVYAPELRGRVFRLNGRDYTHDGYLFAGDRGGAIRGRHIDVFMVDDDAQPMEDIFASSREHTFEAHIVNPKDPMAAAVRDTQYANCE